MPTIQLESATRICLYQPACLNVEKFPVFVVVVGSESDQAQFAPHHCQQFESTTDILFVIEDASICDVLPEASG